MRICPNCGAENEDNVMNCVLCGFEFDETTGAGDGGYVPEQPPGAETLPQQPYQQPYAAPEPVKQKSSVVPVIIAVIVTLLVAGGVGGGIYYMKTRGGNGKSGGNADTGKKTVVQATTADEGADDEKSTTAAATEAATEAASTEAATEKAPEKVDTSAAVKTALKEHLDSEFKKENEQDYIYFDRNPKYAVYDVDADGVDELFISYQNVEGVGTDMYLYKNNRYEKVLNIYTGANICLDNHFIMEKMYGGGELTKIHVISNGTLLQKDSLSRNSMSFTHNDIGITENEYNTLISEYQNMKWIYVPDNSKPVSDLIDMSAYKERPETKYTKYDTSAAGSGFEFYPSARDCKVNTESDDLNLRATPSTNGEIILRIPKNQPVHEFGHDHAWSYVSYNKDGKTYYGYVSKQFILDVNESVQIYPCNKYGTIKVSSGTLSGFKSSYVVDGGQPETVDVVLENGHPVRAFNYCSSKDILWYEVYDEETGEYCGWFDSDFLNF